MRNSFVENSNIAFIGVFRSTCIVQKLNTNEEKVEHFQNEKKVNWHHTKLNIYNKLLTVSRTPGSLYLHWIPIMALKLMSAYE